VAAALVADDLDAGTDPYAPLAAPPADVIDDLGPASGPAPGPPPAYDPPQHAAPVAPAAEAPLYEQAAAAVAAVAEPAPAPTPQPGSPVMVPVGHAPEGLAPDGLAWPQLPTPDQGWT
jgi:hypothetical protein